MRDLPLFGTGLGYRWHRFLTNFFMWVYAIVVALNSLPFFNGELQAYIQPPLQLQYLPNIDIVAMGTGIALILMGLVIIATRFLLAQFKRCALPVFFTISIVDLLLPLTYPLVTLVAIYPFSKLVPLGEVYRILFSEPMHGTVLYPTIVRAVLLVLHIWYYRRRRTDFRN